MRPKHSVFYECIAIVILGLLSTILSTRCKTITNLAFLLIFAALAIILAVFLFRNGIYLSPLYPILAYASNFSLISFLDSWRHERLLKEKTELQHRKPCLKLLPISQKHGIQKQAVISDGPVAMSKLLPNILETNRHTPT